MGDNLTYKILKKHIVDGKLKKGEFIGININSRLNWNNGISST